RGRLRDGDRQREVAGAGRQLEDLRGDLDREGRRKGDASQVEPAPAEDVPGVAVAERAGADVGHQRDRAAAGRELNGAVDAGVEGRRADVGVGGDVERRLGDGRDRDVDQLDGDVHPARGDADV